MLLSARSDVAERVLNARARRCITIDDPRLGGDSEQSDDDCPWRKGSFLFVFAWVAILEGSSSQACMHACVAKDSFWEYRIVLCAR